LEVARSRVLLLDLTGAEATKQLLPTALAAALSPVRERQLAATDKSAARTLICVCVPLLATFAFSAPTLANDYWICQESGRVRYVTSEQVADRPDHKETTACVALYYSTTRKVRPLWRSRNLATCRPKAETFVRSQACHGGAWQSLVPMHQYLSGASSSRVTDFTPTTEALIKFTDVLKFDYDWLRGRDSHEDAVAHLATHNIMRVDEGYLSKDYEKVSLVAIKGTCGTSADYCQNVLVAWDPAGSLILLGDFSGQLVLMPRHHDPVTGLPKLVVSENTERLPPSCLTRSLEFYERLQTGSYDRPKRVDINPEGCPDLGEPRSERPDFGKS